MTAQWFCYEKGLRGWAPVVYYGERPGKSINGQGPERFGEQLVPDECKDSAGEPLFFKLQQMFPPPEIKIEPKIQLPA